MPDHGFLRDLLVIFVVALVVVAALRRLGVPTIAGFIVAGALAGPRALALVPSADQVNALAEVGVVLLLFGIGLELSLDRLRRLWRPILLGGALQVGLTGGLGVLVARAAGFSWGTAIFAGCLVAPSSTAIVLRALGARGEVDAPHGRLTLGVLVFQDLCVLPMMLAIPLLAGGSSTAGGLLETLAKALGIIAGVLVAARIAVPRALHLIARTRQRDLFVLAVLLVCLGVAWAVSAAGVSLALGAFLGGLVVAGSEYRHQALSDLIPFREVLASLFFVSVGMLLDPATLVERAGPVLLLVALTVVGKFLVMLLVGVLLRLPLRVAAQSAVSLAQLGEFLFVLVFAAAPFDVLPPQLRKDLLATAALTMLLAPVALAYGGSIAAGLGRVRLLVRLLDVRTASEAEETGGGLEGHIVVAGLGVTGRELARSLRACEVPYVIVDLNVENVRRATREDEPVYFGDVTSPEVLEALHVERARALVLAINDPDALERSVRAARRVAPRLHIIVRTRYLDDVPALKLAGADEVIAAELEAAVEVVRHALLRGGADATRIASHLARVRTRERGR